MAAKKNKDINYNDLEIVKISEMLAEKQKELREHRFKNANNSLKDTTLIPKTKKEIAKLETAKSAQSQKELVTEGAKNEQ